MRHLPACLAGLLATLPAIAAVPEPPVFDAADHRCPDGAVPLMVLGMYHFAPSGQDKYASATGDVLSPAKQAELAEVLQRLKAYAPTRIAVEAPFKGSTVAMDYTAFLAGGFTLTSNEIHQVGFRLARELGHASLHPVDYPMWMDGRVPAEIGTPAARPAPAKTAGPPPAPAEAPAAVPAVYREANEIMQREPMLSVLRHLNSWQYTRADHAFYMGLLQPDPYSDALYGSTDPVSHWYKRNLRIFTNVLRLHGPNQRLLLVIGSGHNAILRQLAIDSDQFCLVDTSHYLR